ncbi:MAG TPA: sulfotransferase [Acidimicrobiales bacterium]|nr:sulfotransferase [Acidimicrobiales bacterium]
MTTGDGAPVTPRETGAGDKLPRPSTKGEWATAFARSAALGWRCRGRFADVERFCFFIGYPRSGHSLVGSLLNAHREVLIAHELDALGYVEHRFGRSQLYALLLERDQVFASIGRRWMGYDYVVPNQFQGRWSRLRVIGDKRGHVSTYRLHEHPEVLDRLRRVVGVPIRVVHVTRNPYDNIATMARRAAEARVRRTGQSADGSGPELSEAVERYAELCSWIDAIRRRLDPEELHDVVYEEFVARPAESLTELCRFLDVEAETAYVADCAGIVWPQVRRARDGVVWSDADRERVEEVIGRYRVLGGYSWTA